MIVDADGHSIAEGMAGDASTCDGLLQCNDCRDLDFDMFYPLWRHRDDLSVDELRAWKVALGCGPVEILLNSEGSAERDVHIDNIAPATADHHRFRPAARLTTPCARTRTRLRKAHCGRRRPCRKRR